MKKSCIISIYRISCKFRHNAISFILQVENTAFYDWWRSSLKKVLENTSIWRIQGRDVWWVILYICDGRERPNNNAWIGTEDEILNWGRSIYYKYIHVVFSNLGGAFVQRFRCIVIKTEQTRWLIGSQQPDKSSHIDNPLHALSLWLRYIGAEDNLIIFMGLLICTIYLLVSDWKIFI